MTTFAVGDFVTIHSLNKRSDLNGAWGTCQTSVNTESGRIEVIASSGEVVNVKPENLERASVVKGCRVRIVGLEGRKELNGLLGTLQALDEEVGRWSVEMLEGHVLKVLPKCIVRVAEHCSAGEDEEWLTFCKNALPNWRSLPQSVKLASSRFSGGTHSLVRKVELQGRSAHGTVPSECVYAVNKASDADMQRATNSFVMAAGEAGIAPRIYSAMGKHRVMEFCPGSELFGGQSQSHFLTTFIGSSDSGGAADARVMQAVGRAVGILHAMPLDWLSENITAAAFQKQFDSIALVPESVQKKPIMEQWIHELGKAKVLPRSGRFAKPVTCHGDLHGGNVIHGHDNTIRIVDWESLRLGHRGIDLAYFFLCAPGATLQSREAFACSYLGVELEIFDVDELDEFLRDVERCMPLGLVTMISLSMDYAPWLTHILMNLTNQTLATLERANGEISSEILRDGLVNFVRKSSMMGKPGYMPGMPGFMPGMPGFMPGMPGWS